MEQRTYLHHFYSPSKTARESLFFVESAGHYCCDKSFYEDSYYKQNYYLIYVVSGKGYVQNGQNEKTLVTPGQLLYLDLSRPYKYYSHKKDPWEFRWVLFGGRDAGWYYNLITGGNRVIFDLDDNSKIPDFLEDAFRLFDHKDAFLEFRISNLVNNLLTELYIEVMKADGTKKDRRFESPDPVKTVVDFVEQNYFRKITLDELASLTYLNPFYLLKMFKKYTGCTPGEYITRFRIDYAKQLLLKPEPTIEQIALFLGFNTHSYFSMVFKKSTGLTPDQFRKKYMG